MKCRTPQQLAFEFDELQKDLEVEISEGQRQAREKLLNNFDQEVIERVRIQSHAALDRVNERLWRLAQHVLGGDAIFDERAFSFSLLRNPFRFTTGRIDSRVRRMMRTCSELVTRWRSA